LLDRADGSGGLDEEEALSSAAADAAVRRRTTKLVAGTTRWRRRLDFIASTLAGRSMADIDPAVRQILRLGECDRDCVGLHARPARMPFTDPSLIPSSPFTNQACTN
jgi:hypothetical protein